MSFDVTARLNPEFVRILRISLPARRILFIAGATLAFVLVVGGLTWNSYSQLNRAIRLVRASRDSYWVLMTILFAITFVLGPAMTALSFIQEKLRGTAIFQQMVLLSPFDLAAGKFLGNGLISYFIAALILPFSLVAGMLGHVGAENALRLYMFLAVGGVCCQAVGLFVSSVFYGPAERALRGGLLIGPAVGVLGAITALFFSRYFYESYYRGLEDFWWNFFGSRMPAYLVILGLSAFLGAWAFAGAVRRIKVSQFVPVQPWPVWLFFISAEAVLVGLLWGSPADRFRYGGAPPIARLILYLFLNWVAMMILAGSSALDRGRLREWWSAGEDPLGVFQRQEIKNVLKTLLVALGISELGLVALWASYHEYLSVLPPDMFVTTQLVPLAIGFALTIAGMVVFIQYCAMQRFRIRGWAGVALAVMFYLIMGVAATASDSRNNTPALLNPMFYAYALCEADPDMDVNTYLYRRENVDLSDPMRFETIDTATVAAHGLLAEGLLALGCFGLAYVKWRKTQDEMLRERT
jgi:hypothetical protein